MRQPKPERLPQGRRRRTRRPGPERPHRRGLPGQKAARCLERQVRRRAVACLRLLQHAGATPAEVAQGLGVSERTLERWQERWADERLALRALGRPPRHATRSERCDLLAVLKDYGPGLGVPTLCECFPQVARGELREMLARYRYSWRRRHDLLLHELRWRRAGAVWTADFSDPPAPIDGLYGHLLLIRDLGSSEQLAALPTLGEDGEVFRSLLISLCKWHGAPLVLKVDQGSAFIAEETRALAWRLGILLLYSPPRTPEYNGAIEAGNGWIKVRAQEASVAAGRPGEWTIDDVERALQEANATARPFGQYGPTPEEVWQARLPISPEERQRFQRAYRRRYAQECSRRGLPWTAALERREKASVDRIAIRQALVEQGYLAYRRHRIVAPFFRRQPAIKR